MTDGLDIIVVNRCTPEDLSVFLDTVSLYRPSVPFKVWIANVTPEYDDVELAELWRKRDGLPSDHQVFETNVGYAAAVNEMAKRGEHSVIAFFNADVRLTAGALDSCYGALVARDDWATLGPRQIDDRGRIVAGGIFGGEATPRIRDWMQFTGAEDIRDDAVFACGSAVWVKRKIWDELTTCQVVQDAYPGLEGAMPSFDILYFEDSFLGVHARAHGWKNAYLGTTTITHRFHKSIKKNFATEETGTAIFKRARVKFRALCELHDIELERD